MTFKPTAVVAVAAAALAMAATESRGQAFFGGGNGVAFDPEISVVESGAKLDAQATVSADRKYVTLTVRAQTAQLIALRDFVFQAGGGGVVGFGGGGANGGAINGAGGAAGGNNGNPPSAARPAAAARPATPPAGGRSGPLLPALARPAPAAAGTPPELWQEGMRRVDVPPPPAARPPAR
jgi:hypothetical protein